MWIPFQPIKQAFPELEFVPEGERRDYAARALTSRSRMLPVVVFVAGLVGAAWAVLLILANRRNWFPVPMPQSDEWRAIWLIGSAAVISLTLWALVRDFIIWQGVRAEIDRVKCPKCRQSLQGLRVEEIGLGLDPMMRFVRCAECGRKYRLMDLGLTPVDLVPFEQRGMAEDVGKLRHFRRRD